jgi:hypothetical protein
MLVHVTFGPVKRGTNEPPKGAWGKNVKFFLNSNKTWVMEDAKTPLPSPPCTKKLNPISRLGVFLPS